MTVLLENVSKNRDEWLKLRKETIGSSDIATICGLNKYKSPLKLWAEKLGKIPDDADNINTRMGQMLEPVVAERFKQETGLSTRKANTLYQHNDVEWATATPDYTVDEPYLVIPIEGWPSSCVEPFTSGNILECKTTRERNRSLWEAEGIPNFVHTQLLWQMGVCGLKSNGELNKGYTACLIGGFDLIWKELEFDEKAFNLMLERAEQFKRMLDTNTPPETTGEDKKLLHVLSGERNDEIATLPDSTFNIILEYIAVKKRVAELKEPVKEAESIKDELEAKIIQAMGSAKAGVLPDHRIRVSLVERKRKEFVSQATSWWELKVLE